MRKIDIISACSDLGVHVTGSNLGPKILLKNINNYNYDNIVNIKEIEYNSNYIKELNSQNKKKNLDMINIFNNKLYTQVKSTIKNNIFPITIGR